MNRYYFTILSYFAQPHRPEDWARLFEFFKVAA